MQAGIRGVRLRGRVAQATLMVVTRHEGGPTGETELAPVGSLLAEGSCHGDHLRQALSPLNGLSRRRVEGLLVLVVEVGTACGLLLVQAVGLLVGGGMLRSDEIVVMPAVLVTERSETMPSVKPSRSDPESPRKIDAGWKL